MIQEINSLIFRGSYVEALELTEQAIHEDGGLHLHHQKKAEILMALGRREDAAHSLRTALELRPDLTFLQQRIDSLDPAPVEQVTETSISQVPLCGIHDRQPDTTRRRKAEGGRRLIEAPRSDTENHPLVSIITVLFNNPDSLERCIHSVLAQDYPNVEHLIIDAGSDEPTLEIIRKHEPRIDYYVSEPDGGIYAAMNKGIRLARGSYLCLLNSDDSYAASFVSRLVSEALEKRSELVCCDFLHGNRHVRSRGINAGIHFGHLNLNHGAFLVSRRCYDRVGPYSEDFRIISDALWMREAFRKGVRFDHVAEPLFTFADDGLSSGGSQQHRELFVKEVVRSYRAEFYFLTPEEAEEIYLLRFNPKRLVAVMKVVHRKRFHQKFRAAISNYLEHCLRDREEFRLAEKNAAGLLPTFLDACARLDIPKSSIRMETKRGCFSEIIAGIDRTLALRKTGASKTILHFATVFSAASETFIYDLLTRLEEHTAFDNFILCEYRQLEDERPFAKTLWIPWSEFQPVTRNAIYLHIFESLHPDVIIGHFAVNTWKLEQRIGPLHIRIPTISMTHGMDVFKLLTDEAYRKFLLDGHLKRKHARLTTVSRYLRSKLIEFGVPAEKIDLVHNSINPRFRENRKPAGNRQPGDPVRLLAIGRLIGLKGHRHLIQALSIARKRTGSEITLTIVYANGTELLEDITRQIKELDLESVVELIPFVNFDAETDFFGRYDLFVHPSTFSDSPSRNAESFGMSVLEAIASGLPVISTDVGGLPEVIGAPNRFARIVPHADPEALALALTETIADSSSFDDNLAYADQRLTEFSGQAQLTALAKSIHRVTGSINAALFSTSTLQGAGYAAYRLHKGLTAGLVVDSTLFTTIAEHKDEPGVRVVPHPTMSARRWTTLQKASNSWPNHTMFTVNHPVVRNDKLAEWIETADIINLHWTARLLSAENIAWLTHSGKPVVLTFRDMMPITGGCHCFHGCNEWLRNCNNCPQLVDHWDDFPAKVLAAKRRFYQFENLTLVALSKHSENILRQAPYFRDCRIEVIPNSIETDVFKPRGRAAARDRLGLPHDRKIIAYIPAYSSEIKGFREATAALIRLKAILHDENPLVLLVGNETPATQAIQLDKHALGYVHETEALSYVYSAADVVIVPSLEETFSNTTAEAISCGTPVVGFKTGAIPELAIDDQTGYTLEVGDVEGFAQGIAKVLRGPDMSAACREFAESHLRFEIQARRYENLFTELVTMRREPSKPAPAITPESFPETTATLVRLLQSTHR